MFGLQMINEIETFQRELDQLFRSGGLTQAAQPARNRVRMNLQDTGEAFVIEAPLPGVNAEQLDIQVLERRLTISGEYASTEHEDAVTWHRQERVSGAFQQTLLLPVAVDNDRIVADYKNGILSITLPKAASALPKQISIKVA
ncbi:MAG TPA: Hsp20/alpha crystallin family protein [Malonomonas sp.]